MVPLQRFWFFSCWIFHHFCIVLMGLLLISDHLSVTSQENPYNSNYLNPQVPVASAETCNSISSEWKILSDSSSQRNPASQTVNFQSICRSFGQSSCCSKSMETEMVGFSTRKLKKAFKEHLQPVIKTMENQKMSLSYIIHNLLVQAQSKINEMLSIAFSNKFSEHKVVLSQFISDLQAYMSGSKNNLFEIVDQFLQKIMETVVNFEAQSKGNFDLAKSKCIAQKLGKQQPYGLEAIKIKGEIKNSFVQTRMVLNALSVGKEILQDLKNKSKFDDTCLLQHSQMSYCHICAGYEQIRPCLSICSKVVTNCFQQHAHLNSSWFQFIDELISVSVNVQKNDFSKVTKDMGMLVMSAIMTLKRSYKTHSKSLEAQCNIPFGPSRSKRQAADFNGFNNFNNGRSQDFQQPGFNTISNYNPNRFGSNQISGTGSSNPLFSTIIQIRTTIPIYKRWFSTIPFDFCSQSLYGYQAISSPPCWNGTAVTLRMSPLHQPPPLNSNDLTDPAIKHAIRRLELMADRLKRSLNEDPDYLPLDNSVSQQPKLPNSGQNKPPVNNNNNNINNNNNRPDDRIPENPQRPPFLPPIDQEGTADIGSGKQPIPEIPTFPNIPSNPDEDNRFPPTNPGDPGSGEGPVYPKIRDDTDDETGDVGSGSIPNKNENSGIIGPFKPDTSSTPPKVPTPVVKIDTTKPEVIVPEKPIAPKEKENVNDKDFWRDAPPAIWIPVRSADVPAYGVSKSQKKLPSSSNLLGKEFPLLLTFLSVILSNLFRLNI